MNSNRLRHMVRGAIIPVLAIFTALLAGAFIIWLAGPKFAGDWLGLRFVWDGYSGLLNGAFGSGDAIINTLVRATPYIFAGLAVALAFRCGLFNIGAEGQLLLGALGAAWVGFGIEGLPAVIHLPLTLLGGMAGGFLWGAIPGFLKARTGAHEVITTIMLNYIASQLGSYLLGGPWKDPNPLNVVAQTPRIAEAARLPQLLPGLHWGCSPPWASGTSSGRRPGALSCARSAPTRRPRLMPASASPAMSFWRWGSAVCWQGWPARCRSRA
jgi:general nucleoside transport system permease protein